MSDLSFVAGEFPKLAATWRETCHRASRSASREPAPAGKSNLDRGSNQAAGSGIQSLERRARRAAVTMKW